MIRISQALNIKYYFECQFNYKINEFIIHILTIKLLANMFKHQSYPHSVGTRKKIQNYSYGLNDKIGKGYSSIVYKGKNDDTNQIVAIKVIDMKGVKDEVGKEMLQCEIEALKTLKHPNILKCFDVFTTINNCYIITQFCNQGDLASLITKKRKLTQAQTLNFLRDISQGFIQMASNNYLHRDLKLANIFLNDGVAKIADFGFAKKNKNPGQKQRYNVGSPLYMSPQALRKNIYSTKNDIWSVGVLIYQLLHGQTPWECKTQKELMDKMVRIPVNFTVKISDDLKQFIRKCLQVEESKRMSLQDMKNNSLIKRISQQSQIPPQPQSIITAPSHETSVLGRIQQNIVKKSSENKQNNTPTNAPLKSVIQKNNNILVHHINVFRLLYKIVDKLKINYSQQSGLIQLLSNDVLNKVNYLKTMILNPQKNQQTLDLKQIQKYMNQSLNPSIKKYKTVISEYHKKYNSELKRQSLQNDKSENIDIKLKEFIKRHEPNEKQIMLYHWIVEYFNIPKDIRKDYLQNIIQPKVKPTLEQVTNKIKYL